MRKAHGLLIIVLLFSCGPALENNNSSVLRITDFRGKEIVFSEKPQRIVCLIESALSGLYMLGADSLIAGVPSAVYNESVSEFYAALDPRIAAKKLPSPGNWDHLNMESLLSLQPDLVIIWAQQTESIQAIERMGIPVYGVMLKSFEDVHREILDLGKITGKEQRAAELIEFTQKMINEIPVNTEMKKPGAYFMWAQGPLETSGRGSTADELLRLAGTENVITSDEEHLIINTELLLEADPDIIIMWFNQKLDAEDIVSMPVLATLKAVKNKMIFELPSVFYCDFWTLKYPYAVRLVAHHAHGNVWTGFDSGEYLRQMMSFLYGEKALAFPMPHNHKPF
jgi:iron complex transport system substrate-binding protein